MVRGGGGGEVALFGSTKFTREKIAIIHSKQSDIGDAVHVVIRRQRRFFFFSGAGWRDVHVVAYSTPEI